MKAISKLFLKIISLGVLFCSHHLNAQYFFRADESKFSEYTNVLGDKNDTTKWYNLLPGCPCRNPDFDSIHLNDGWAREPLKEEMRGLQKLFASKKNFKSYHVGAEASFRSYPAVNTIIDGKKFHSGQQCTYDKTGNLIKSGAGAGTPDKVCPVKGENKKGLMRVSFIKVMGHYKYDAKPFKKMDWKTYHIYWPPHKGAGCN